MGFVLFLIACPLAALGAYWLFDFFFWLSNGRVLAGRIERFQDKKDKGFALPVVSIETKRGELRFLETNRIDQIMYCLVRPNTADYTTIIVKPDSEGGLQARVFGYIYPILGALLVMLLIVAASFAFESSRTMTQALYVITFAVVVVGGWMVLKLIQGSEEA